MPTSTREAKPTSVRVHYLRYANANVLSMLAGFLSFPVMARLLTQSDFGVIGYYETFALIWMAVLKLGSQHAIVRFYASHCLNRPEEEQRSFYTTCVGMPALVSTALFALTIVALVIWNRVFPNPQTRYLYYVLAVGHLAVLASFVENVMRAREQSLLTAGMMVTTRYLNTIAVIAMIVLVSRSATGVFVGRLIAAAVMLALMLRWYLPNCKMAPRTFNAVLFRAGLAFGMPLVLGEIANVLLAFVDRVMLKSILGQFSDVGTYYLGYNLAMNFGVILGTSVYQAFSPTANRVYETEGAEEVRRLKRRMVRTLAYVAALIVALLFLVGREAFVLLAGAGKAASVPVFQWVGVNYAIAPVLDVAGYGLVLQKRSRLVSGIVVASALLNVAMNLVLIPRCGIMGAVYATLASYIFMGVAQIGFCPPSLRTVPGWDVFGKPVLLAGLLLAVGLGSNLFGLHNPWLRIVAAVALSGALYAVPALYLDEGFRKPLAGRLPFLRG